jgi:hypothetical protein
MIVSDAVRSFVNIERVLQGHIGRVVLKLGYIHHRYFMYVTAIPNLDHYKQKMDI